MEGGGKCELKPIVEERTGHACDVMLKTEHTRSHDFHHCTSKTTIAKALHEKLTRDQRVVVGRTELENGLLDNHRTMPPSAVMQNKLNVTDCDETIRETDGEA